MKKFDKVGYNNKYNSTNYDRITVLLPIGTREQLRKHAASQGESVTAFIARAVREQIKRDSVEKVEE